MQDVPVIAILSSISTRPNHKRTQSGTSHSSNLAPSVLKVPLFAMFRFLPILAALLILGAGLVILLNRPDNKPSQPSPGTDSAQTRTGFSDFAAVRPDWSELENLQKSVTRTEFENDLTKILALPNAWQTTINITPEAALIRHNKGKNSQESKIFFSRKAREPDPLPPLDQIHIAIDPGHIGGDFAKIEERYFHPFPDDLDKIPVCEGDLALSTAHHLKPLLENLGATVTLVRETAEPVTKQRTRDFISHFPDRPTAQRAFYRSAEIRARAQLVNEVIKPDLVLCLHYNAEALKDHKDPWAPLNHFHLIINGAYTPAEVALDDHRFEMLRHLFTHSTRRALPLARTMSDVFLRETDLVPFHYRFTSPALHADPVRPIYARNLMANRLYQAPTIFLEPYVTNHRETYDRVQMGDYEGFRKIKGTNRRSLVQEYAHTIAKSFAEFYAQPKNK